MNNVPSLIKVRVGVQSVSCEMQCNQLPNRIAELLHCAHVEPSYIVPDKL
jgi:hypothetical protein